MAVGAALVAAGCDANGQRGATGPGVRVQIAPLNLPGVTDAEYQITVRNGASSPEIVFQRDISADRYGDSSGSVSYVAPCDADRPQNTVSLKIVRLKAGSADLVAGTDYSDPTADGPISRTFTCHEGTDTPVDFDLTVARRAEQGFFDVAVSFSDLFCSAKLDCQGDDGDIIALLHGPDGRGRTIVLGFACTARLPGQSGATTLYLDDIDIACAGGAAATVDPSQGPGNLALGAGYTVTGAGTLFGAAVYQGQEHLGYNKAYWNVALGLEDPAAASCVLSTSAAATDDLLVGNATRAGAVYPYITWNVPLTDAEGALICTQHAIGDGTGVAIAYTDGTNPHSFDHVFLTEPPASGLWDAATWDVNVWAP